MVTLADRYQNNLLHVVTISDFAGGPSKAKDQSRIGSRLVPPEAMPQVRTDLEQRGGLGYSCLTLDLTRLQSGEQTTSHEG